jgi:hypothetical protein
VTTQPRNTSPAARGKVTINDVARAAAVEEGGPEDDVSVAQGFFSVTVCPWQVMMQAWPG